MHNFFYDWDHDIGPEYFSLEYYYGLSFPMHMHRTFELILVYEGTIKMRVEKEEYELKAGDMLLVKSNFLHSISTDETSLTGVCIFSPELIGTVSPHFKQYPLTSPVIHDVSPVYWELLKGIDKSSSISTYAPEETETDLSHDVERNDYKEEVFRMIGFDAPGSWYYAEEYSTQPGSVHILNNTIYEMNTLIEDYLNIQIEYEQIDHVSTGGEIFDTVKPTIMSGDDTYQLCILHPYYSYTSFITKNYALDFYDLPDLDMEQPYWNKEVMEQLSINDHAYIGLGDICKYTIGILYCNKDMLKDVDIAVPYDTVRNGKWTLDEFFAMTSGLYADNGDGKRNNSDIYGYASLWDANASSFMQASDIYIATRNDEGVFELSMYGDRLVDMYDKLYNWSKNESTYLWSFANKYNESVNIDFLDSQMYFTHADLGTQYLEASFGVGMLPMPKYDAEQPDYAHVNWGNNIIIPTTVKNKAMVGQVLELMGFYSRTMVQQKYYDEVLQLRVSDAPDDREMVELIYNTIVYDPGIAFCDGNTQLWNLVYLPCFAIQNNAANISSYYKGNSRSAERWLANLFKE